MSSSNFQSDCKIGMLKIVVVFPPVDQLETWLICLHKMLDLVFSGSVYCASNLLVDLCFSGLHQGNGLTYYQSEVYSMYILNQNILIE